MSNSVELRVVEWRAALSDSWDRFVLESAANGTIFQTRHFLSYHPEGRFDDRSLLLYAGEELVAVVPAAAWEGGVMSHPGTSCGGPVIHRDWWSVERLFPLLEAIDSHYGEPWGMRLAEPWFSTVSTAPLLWHYSRNRKLHPFAELSAAIDLDGTDPLDKLLHSKKRRALRNYAFKRDLTIRPALHPEEYSAFYHILVSSLERHQTKPVHSLQEFLKVADLLKEKQELLLAIDSQEKMIAGFWTIEATATCRHAQYSARKLESSNSVIDALMVQSMRNAKQRGSKIFSLGISTEERGALLNRGLLAVKEQLGARFELRHLLLPTSKTELERG